MPTLFLLNQQRFVSLWAGGLSPRPEIDNNCGGVDDNQRSDPHPYYTCSAGRTMPAVAACALSAACIGLYCANAVIWNWSKNHISGPPVQPFLIRSAPLLACWNGVDEIFPTMCHAAGSDDDFDQIQFGTHQDASTKSPRTFLPCHRGTSG